MCESGLWHHHFRTESRRLEVAVRELAEAARTCGAVLASHDDDSAADIDRARALGVTIAEFPMSLEAATAARKADFQVVMDRSMPPESPICDGSAR